MIIKAPRGGGKSKLLGTLSFDLWYLKNRSVVNMGGSLAQAEVVYKYFQDYTELPTVYGSVEGGENGVKMKETVSTDGVHFWVVPASPKQVRGKHPDTLISDETCETSDELIDSALPMVNDSQTPLVVMASTFHKIFGRFAETWDNARERGYLRIQWDIFDVASSFQPDYWENGIMKDGTFVRSVPGILQLKAMAKGRTGDPEGWIDIDSVVQAWREKPTLNWFEVEYMGSRPSAEGLVLNPEDVDDAIFDEIRDTRFSYKEGAVCVIGIDWGFSTMTSVVEIMGMQDEDVAVLNNLNFHQIKADEIITDVVLLVKQHGIKIIYADSAGKFENAALQAALIKANTGCTVVEVVFSKEKFGKPGKDGSIGMIGNLRAHFEQKKIKIPERLRDAYYQLKNYRYQPGTDKPVKKDDHIPDALMCALQHFVLGRHVEALTAPEKAQTRTPTMEIPTSAFAENRAQF